jgi:hypothetical protein
MTKIENIKITQVVISAKFRARLELHDSVAFTLNEARTHFVTVLIPGTRNRFITVDFNNVNQNLYLLQDLRVSSKQALSQELICVPSSVNKD